MQLRRKNEPNMSFMNLVRIPVAKPGVKEVLQFYGKKSYGTRFHPIGKYEGMFIPVIMANYWEVSNNLMCIQHTCDNEQQHQLLSQKET